MLKQAFYVAGHRINGRDAEAGGSLDHFVIELNFISLDGQSQFFSDFHSSCLVSAGQKDGELFATQPSDHVTFPQQTGASRNSLRENLIAGGVAERVVRVLEIIQIQ